MPYHYVEDYEEVTGKKPEPAPVDTMQTVEAKVIEAPKKAPAKKTTAKVETKAPAKKATAK